MWKIIIHKRPPPYKNKEDYIVNTSHNTRGSYDSPSETDGYVRHLGEEHNNEEDEECIETNPEINDSIKSKIIKGITEEDVIISLLAKKYL